MRVVTEVVVLQELTEVCFHTRSFLRIVSALSKPDTDRLDGFDPFLLGTSLLSMQVHDRALDRTLRNARENLLADVPM